MRNLVRGLSTLLLLAPLTALATLPAGAASTVAVQSGAASADQAVQALQYYPGKITVDVGDTVTWSVASGEPHSVSFGTLPGPYGSGQNNAPAGGSTYDGSGWVSSGLFVPGKNYSLTFTKEGTFNYGCAIHPSMRGTVVVQPAGSPYPADQASYKPSGDAALTATIKAGQAALDGQKVTTKANADGTTTYALNAGIGDGKTYAIQRYGANDVTIHTGDTVVWTQNDPNEIHTVTFLDNGQDVPFELPDGKTNPKAAAPAGGKVYNGSGFFNSGILTPANTPAPGPHSYALTFGKPGTYEYICVLHDELGMKGTITVLAATPTGLPKTGGLPIAAVVLVGLGLIGGGVAVARRQSSQA